MQGMGENAMTDTWKLSPFARWIENSQSITEVQFLTFTKYFGKMKARVHMLSFEAHVGLITMDKCLKSNAFLSILQGLTLTWFGKLPLGSFVSWEVLKTKFFNEFASSGIIPKDQENSTR